MLSITAKANPFRSDIVQFERASGQVLAELVVEAMQEAGQPVELARAACVTVDEVKIDKGQWLEVVPPDGARVVILALPTGDFLGTFVQFAAIAVANFLVPGSGYIAFAIKAGITLGGTLLAQALTPTPRQRLSGQSDGPTPASYSITGVRNTANPYGTIPMQYGRLVNYHPPLAAAPYTDANNAYGDQYLYMAFAWMGESVVSDIQVGTTPLSSLRNVTIETRTGAPGESGITLFPGQVRDQALNVQLRYNNGFTYRTTEPDTDEIVVEVLFPNGMGRITDRNEKLGIRVAFQVLYYGAGFSGFAAAPIVADNQFSVYIEGGGIFSVQGYNKAAVRRSVRFNVPRGEYSVGVARVTIDDQSDSSGKNQSTTFEDSYLVSIRSVRFEAPYTQTGLAAIAVRAQANEQLNGTVDDLNCTVQRLLPIWNGSTWSAPQATRNPAWAYCDVLRGAGIYEALTDDRIDLARILTWAQQLDAAGITFDGVFDDRAAVWERLQEIAATGFASPTVRDGRFSVIHDTVRDTIVQHFSPRNTRSLRVSRTFADLPHALTVRFPNEQTLHQTDEIIVYDDGYTAANATKFEALDLPYTTSALQAWRAGRRYMASGRLRPRIISIETDLEFLICERGDLVRLTHDVMQIGIGSARVRALTLNGGGDLTAVTLDAPLPMAGGTSYALRFRLATGATVYAPVNTVPGESAVFTLTTPILFGGTMPAAGDHVLFGVAGAESGEFIVRSIEPRADLTATVTLVDYSPAIFSAHLAPIPDFNPGITLPPLVARRKPPTPIILSVDSDERALVRLGDGTLQPRVLLAYELRPTQADLPAQSIQIRYRSMGTAGDPEFLIVPVQTGTISIQPVEEGDTVLIELRAVAAAGATSEWVSTTHTVIGRTSLPPDIERFYRQANAVTWPYPEPPIDLAGFQLRAQYGTSTAWETARTLHAGLVTAPPFDISDLSGTQTILIKAVDTAGNESANAATVALGLGDLLVANVVETQSEAPAFGGELTGGTDTGTQIEAALISSPPLYGTAGAPFYEGAGADDFYEGNVYDSMQYIARYTPDTLYLSDGLLKIDLTVVGDYTVDFRIATSPAFYGAGASPFYGAAGDPLYDASTVSEWASWPGVLGPFESTSDTYEVRVTTAGGITRGIVSQFDLITDLPDVVESLEDVVIAAASTRLPITKTYRVIKAVQLTTQTDGNGGMSGRVIDKDATLGPDVEVLNAAGTAVIGLVDATIQGY